MAATSEPESDPETALEDLPASAILVYKVLEYQGGRDRRQQLLVATTLQERTFGTALRQLKDAGIVQTVPDSQDGRQRQVELVGD
jgi:DNA-binding transcriptional ArsR family regulator